MFRKYLIVITIIALLVSAIPASVVSAATQSINGIDSAVVFYSSFEDGSLKDETDEPVDGKSTVFDVSGASSLSVETASPDNNICGESRCGYTGKNAVKVSGQHTANGEGKTNVVLYSGLQIPVGFNTQLSYMFYPDYSGTTFDNTSQFISIDLKFSDGTYLSETKATDEYGNLMNPLSLGKAECNYFRQWNNIYCDLSSVAKMKVVSDIIVSYNKDTAGKDIIAYFDDIKISNIEVKKYSSPVEYALTTRGSQNSDTYSHGSTFPAACVPNGFNFWTPFTGSGKYIYNYQQSEIYGFGVSHQANAALLDRGVFTFMPEVYEKTPTADSVAPSKRKCSFSHTDEVANPNYYAVTLSEDSIASGVKVEMSPTDHAAIIRVTYPSETAYPNLVFDSYGSMKVNGSINFNGNSFSASTDYADATLSVGATTTYIYGEFVNATPKATYSYTDSTGRPYGAASFDKGTNEVVLKIATSYISTEQAKKNLNLEISSDDTLETVKAKAAELWNDILSKIEVKGASDYELITLYSSLYRIYCYPTNYSENTGTNESPKIQYASPYKSTNDNPVVLDGQLYTSNGFWDTYRTAWPAYALLTPEKDSQLLDGILQHYRENGSLGRWLNPAGMNSMIGTSYDIIFADAASKGVEFDYQTAYEACLHEATANYGDNYYSRTQSESAPYIGYTANNGGNSAISWTLEEATSDAAISKLAKIVGDDDNYEYFRNRSLNYANVFNKDANLFMAKNADGSFAFDTATFDATKWQTYGYVETNAWGMCVSVTHDAKGLANLYGGLTSFAAKLDSIFSASNSHNGNATLNHEITEAVDVNMGQYQHNNQPSHHIAYMYNYAGQAYKTQYYTRRILDRLFSNSSIGMGYIGDEDNGEQSAWYVLSALGIYPMNAGSDEYCITSPLYDKVTLHLASGDLVIKANNNSKENVYIQSCKIDGKTYDKCYITQSKLNKSKEIVFEMGSEPSQWGCSESSLPSSISYDDNTPTPMEDYTTGMTFASSYDITGDTPQLYCTNAVSPEKIINNNSNSDSSAVFEKNSASIYFHLPTAKTIRQYTITSGNAAMAPSQFQLYASVDGKEWEKIDNRINEKWQWDLAINAYAVDNKTAYNYYRLDIANPNLTSMEINEIQLIGIETYVEPPVPQPEYTYGDINNDESVDSKDALAILQYAVGKSSLDEEQLIIGDVDLSGSVDSSDSLMILQRAVGKIDSFPAEQQ